MWGDRLISEKTIRTDVFYPAIGKFPTVCQEYLKTSMTRLYFVADRIDLGDVWKPAQDGSGHYPAAEHVLVIAVVLQGSKNVIENTSQVGKVWNV